MSISQILLLKAQNQKLPLTNNFNKDIPYWERLFNEVLIELRQHLDGRMKEENLLLTLQIVSELCNPNPLKRGHKRNIDRGFGQYDMERFISELDRLAKKAEYKNI